MKTIYALYMYTGAGEVQTYAADRCCKDILKMKQMIDKLVQMNNISEDEKVS